MGRERGGTRTIERFSRIYDATPAINRQIGVAEQTETRLDTWKLNGPHLFRETCISFFARKIYRCSLQEQNIFSEYFPDEMMFDATCSIRSCFAFLKIQRCSHGNRIFSR